MNENIGYTNDLSSENEGDTALEGTQSFAEWLQLRGYSENYIKQFGYYEGRILDFMPDGNLTQQSIDSFLKNRHTRNARAFCKLLTEFLEVKGIVVPPLRGVEKTPSTHYFSEQEIENILPSLKPKYKLMVRIMFETGLRISEVMNLRKMDFNPGRFTLSGIGKNKKAFEVEVSEKLGNEIFDWVEKWRFEDRPIFGGKRKKVLSRQSVNMEFMKVARQLGLKGFHPHALRHSCATHLLNKEVDIRIIKEILRHDSLNTTERYTHVTNDRVRKEWAKAFEK